MVNVTTEAPTAQYIYIYSPSYSFKCHRECVCVCAQFEAARAVINCNLYCNHLAVRRKCLVGATEHMCF